MAPTVLLMLKAPIEGEVKTRLGREIGAAAATAAYRSLVEHQVRNIPAAWPIHICHAPVGARSEMQAWLGAQHHYTPQADGDLGARLTCAVDEHFQSHAGPLLILGGDCPYLESDVLRAAAAALETAGAVLVPADDGGYCLIGLRAAEAHLFHDIAWSTETVLAETRQRLRERQISWVELAVMEDVDDGPSWRRALQAFPQLLG